MGSKGANEMEYKAAIDIALVALRSAILINGGAAIAILAFWGNALGAGSDNVDSSHIASALGHFAQGVLSGGIATVAAYLAQRAFSFISDTSRVGGAFNITGLLLVGWAYWCFYSGIIECQAALMK